METTMIDPHMTGGSAGFHGLPPDEWERRRWQILRDAHVARAELVRDLFDQILFPVRRAAEGARDLARTLAVRAGARVRRWGRDYATWRTRQQAIQELAGLDDRALKDFGINRSEIESVVYGRHAEPVTEGKLAARLFHMPYDRSSTWVNPQSKRLVQESWRQVAPIADAAAERFYQRLFEIDPPTRKLFHVGRMAEQRRKVVQALTLAVEGLDNLDALLPAIRDLGRRHDAYGVNDRHYESVGVALLWTLQQGLGAAWTPALASAWTEVYVLLSDAMRQAAREAAAHDTRAVAA
jgi:hemoglobin-like flavoprotein/uncharacterized protein YjiS (DUF1127 family)